MPDTEISRLIELPASLLEEDDVLAIVDISASETKKISATGLVGGALEDLPDGSVDPDKINWDTAETGVISGAALKDRSVAAVKIIANSLTATEIAPNAIGASELADSAVDTAAIKADAVTAGKIADNQIGDEHIIGTGLGTDSIADGAITRVKMTLKDNDIDGSVIAGNSITSAEIGPNAVGASELANNAVDTSAIQDNAVIASKIADSQIGDAHIVADGLGTDSIKNGAVTRDKMTLKENDIDGSIIDNDSITQAEIGPNAIGASELADNAVDTAAIQASAVTANKIAVDQIGDQHIVPGGLGTDSIKNGAITRAKMTLNANDIDGSIIDNDSITSAEIGPNAVGANELADNSVDTQAIQSNAVTSDKIISEAVLTRHIGLLQVTTATLQDASVTVQKLVNSSVSTVKLQNNSVTAEKLADDLPGSILGNGAIDTNQIADDAVTEAKINDGSITTDKLASAAVTDVKVSNVSGSKLDTGSVEASKFADNAFGGGLEVDGVVRHINEIDAGSQAGIRWDSHGHVVGFSQVPSEDLPIATTSTVGVISVPTNSGLTVSNTGEIDHFTLISQGRVSGISYDEHGHITNAVALAPTDLPVATNTTIGGVRVPTQDANPLSVDGSGSITHSTASVSAGTYVSVDVDEYGHVSAGESILLPGQIPGISADKITSGQFPTARLEDESVTMPKLADYSIGFIQEAQPAFTVDLHIGCLWYQPSTAQLRMFDGNVWASVGFGRLSQENLRFGGTIDAESSLIVALTDAGRTAGLSIGTALPAATDSLGGLYVVVSEPGDNIAVVPDVTFDAGDWCLCINAAEGWVRIDTLNGDGSGGGLIRLNDLLDVDINEPRAGDTLIYDPTTGQWTNRTTTADRVTMAPAFDGTTTAFTLSMDILDQNNVLLSVGGVIMEPGVDFQVASGTRNLNFATPPPEDSPYFMMNQQTVNASSGGGGGGGGGTTLPPGSSAEELLKWDNSLGAWTPSSIIDGGTY